MRNYKLKTITPVHVSSGNKLQKTFDFMVFRDRVNVLSFDKFLASLTEKESSLLEKLIEQENYENIYRDINKPIESYSKYSLRLLANNNDKPREISEHIKTILNKKGDYGAYIPGSTVKGFIRFAILFQILKYKSDLINCEEEKGTKKLQDRVRSIEEGIFIKNYLNLMTFFKVFDSDPIGIEHLEVRNVTLFPRRSISEYAELIKENTETYISIKDNEFEEKLKKLGIKSEQDEYIKKIKDWKEACYELSKSIIEHEIEFFSNNKEIKSSKEIKSFYEELKDQNKPESPLLRIGKYKGKISQTLILLKDRIRCIDGSYPKTRRVTENKIGYDQVKPIGWVKLENAN
ncbi:MAG: type III-A CRISPR-associated RAMP protein Csm5 [Hydrogenobaculum sp.]